MPTKLRVLHGETRPSQIGSGEPAPSEAEPEPPAWFTAEQHLVWERVRDELRGMGLLYRADQDTIVGYVLAMVYMSKCAQLINGSNILLKGADGGLVRNPAMTELNQMMSQLNRFSRELGLTPSARVGMGALSQPDKAAAAARLLS
jgi:P27 family predicted phage terminase small subunit